MSDFRQRTIAVAGALATAVGCLACRTIPEAPEAAAPISAPSGAASTRSLPDVDVGAEQPPSIDPNAASGAGTLLIYSSVAGHVPYREVTREGVQYRGKTKEELEANRGASIEAEIATAMSRQGASDADAFEAPDMLPPDLTGQLHVPRVAPLTPVRDRETAVILSSARVSIAKGRWGNAQILEVIQREIDLNGDGRADETRFVDAAAGQILRAERDTNGDGQINLWDTYDGFDLVRRKRDSNGDGHADAWEEYVLGRLNVVRLDRDHDGSIDAVHRYESISLVEERYDTDADGKIDLVLSYVNRVLVKVQEDRSRDGQTDTWTTYRLIDGEEVVARVDRDRNGDGNADVRKVYQRQGVTQGEYDDLAPL